MAMIARATHKMGIVEDARAASENPRVTNLLGDPRMVSSVLGGAATGGCATIRG